jgi:AcrR family transcriptional regulator
MPPKIRFSKADILHVAFNITREKGIDAVNARAIAKELGCSTQPVFRAFHTMEQIKLEMMRMSMNHYSDRIIHAEAYHDKLYLGTGIAYIDFARDEPELFKLLFMRDRHADKTESELKDQSLDYVIRLVIKRTGLTPEKAMSFHKHLWVTAHGLATMIATQFSPITHEEAEQLLTEEYLAMCKLYGIMTPQE